MQLTKEKLILELTPPLKLELPWLKNIRLNLKSNWLNPLNNKKQLLKNNKKNKQLQEKLKLMLKLDSKLFF
jgi:hypothetical protein